MAVVRPLYFAKLRRARAAWVFDLGPATLVFATILLVWVTSLLYLTQASRVAATGYDISSAADQRAKLERQELILARTAAELQSLSRVEGEATSKLGMAPAPPSQFIRVGPPPVDVEAAVKRAEREAEHRPETWGQRIAAALRLGGDR